MRVLFAVLVIIVLFSFAFSGFFASKNGDIESTKTYQVIEGPPVEGKKGLNIIELRLEEYSTPTPIPTDPPPPVDIPTPTFGPSPTPRPTRIPTPTPSAPTPTRPPPTPTTPPLPPTRAPG